MGTALLETAKDLFSLIDKQQKGYILKEELSLISDDFTDSQLHSVFSALDKDGEGKITLNDFAEAFIALSRSQYDENSKQSGDEEPSVVRSGTARGECFNLYDNSTYCAEDTGGSALNDISETITHSRIGLQDSAVKIEAEKSSEDPSCYSAASNCPMLNEHCHDSDDVFEGEGLRADEQNFGASPSRPQYLRSPSLHRRKRATDSQSCISNTIGPEITDRSPPDGNEEDHRKPRRSQRRTRKSVTLEKPKTQVCIPSSGFAKDAILDVLKIVDSHTIANLGLYENSRAAWRRNMNMNSSNVFGGDYQGSVDTWSPNVANKDCEFLSNEMNKDTRRCFHCEHKAAESRLTESEACSDYFARGISQGCYLHSDAASNCTSDDGSTELRLGVFSPSSGCSDHTYSEFNTMHQLDDRDSNENIFTFEDRGILKSSEEYHSHFVSAKVEKETKGNMVFDSGCERRECLYDRILSLSGVELNSRMSSSETSLHDLILEAEVAKKSAALVEDWESVMKRVNGVSLFGGNQVICYLWQQLSVHHTDLLQPFEDFIKSVVAEVNRAYSKCQELESKLQSKSDLHEREMTRVYDDMDQLLAREKEQSQKNQAEREDHLRTEFNRITDMKDADMMDALRSKADIESKLDKMQQEYQSLRIAKEKLEKQLHAANASEVQIRSENDYLTQENFALTDKLKTYAQNISELQEQFIKLSKVAEANKENYRRCYRKYQDALEEKEFFDMNISNLNQEVQDLRNANKSLQERVDNSLNTSILWRDGQVSPKLEQSLELSEKIPSRVVGFPNGIMPITKSQRNSLVSEPSFEESIPDVAVANAPSFPVPDLIPAQTREIKTPPKTTSTPLKGDDLNKRVKKATFEAIPTTAVQHTGQEYKVVFVGDAAVGKTSLIRKISRGTFSSRRETTSSPDFVKKMVTVDNQSIALNIWDTVGQERFNSLPPSYFRKADVVVLVYDIIEKVSFLNVKSWIKTIYEYTDENVLLVLCGNKSDLDHRRQVKEDKAIKVAKINDAIYMESSAKTGYNVNELCETIASTLLERDDTVVVRETSVTMLQQDLLDMSKSNRMSCC